MVELKEKIGTGLIVLVAMVVAVVFLIIEPVAQDLKYHDFSDTNGILNIPNTLNVFSNIPFIVVGAIGLGAYFNIGGAPLRILDSNRLAYLFLFSGSVLVGLGSGYYHLSPENETLVWDRMPMTIAFMALYSIIISEFISQRIGRLLLFPLLLLGIGSVLYWWVTEERGVGDLRLYAVVQFLPILTIPMMLVCYNPKFNGLVGYWVLIMAYVCAKLFEMFDYQTHSFLRVISGHSVKHLLPAIGLFYLITIYKKRVAI